MNEKIIENYKVPPQGEQETIITYDNETKEWHVFTDVPKHARKYEALIDETKPFRKGYSVNGGALSMLEGTLNECNVIISKKRKMTEEQKKALADRLRRNK